MTQKSANGSTDLLAQAMRRVFTETVQKDGTAPVKDVRDGLKQDVDRAEQDADEGPRKTRP